MFINVAGERFRVLCREAGGAWVISYDEYRMPSYIDKMEFGRAERIAPPQEYVKNMERPRSEAQQVRYQAESRRLAQRRSAF